MKISLTVQLDTLEEQFFYQGIGILDKNKISYIEDNIITTIHLHDDYFTINRKTNDYNLKISLSPKETSSYTIKGVGTMNVKVDITKIHIEKNSLSSAYSLTINNVSMGSFQFLLHYKPI